MTGQAKSKPESARGGQSELLFGAVKPRKRRQEHAGGPGRGELIWRKKKRQKDRGQLMCEVLKENKVRTKEKTLGTKVSSSESIDRLQEE